MHKILLIIFTLASLWLQACSPVAIGTSVGASAAIVVLDDRSLAHSLADINLKGRIVKDLTTLDKANFIYVNIDVFEGRVLASGVVPTSHIRKKIVEVLNEYEEVWQIINEIRVGEKLTIETIANDEIVKLQINTRLMLDKNIRSINYITRVVNNEVLIIGLADNITERQLILSHIKSVNGVTALYDFINFKDDPDRLKWLAKQQ